MFVNFLWQRPLAAETGRNLLFLLILNDVHRFFGRDLAPRLLAENHLADKHLVNTCAQCEDRPVNQMTGH